MVKRNCRHCEANGGGCRWHARSRYDGRRKLTPDDLRIIIERLRNEKPAVLAKEYGVHAGTIRRLKHEHVTHAPKPTEPVPDLSHPIVQELLAAVEEEA